MFELELQKLLSSVSLISPADVKPIYTAATGKIRIREEQDAHVKSLMLAAGVTSFADLRFGLNEGEYRPYPVTADGVAIITVHGVLLNRLGWWGGYVTGYDSIVMRVRLALQDPDVKVILLDVHSGGGSAAGCFETAEFLREADAEKPVYAHVNSTCCSAAYALASGARKIYATPSASIGSIGVVLVHWSYEQMIANDGLEISLIYAGDHKVDGNYFQNLPDKVREKYQGEVNALYNDFTALVAKHRGISQDDAKATEADIFSAARAIELGLADELVAGHELPDFLSNLTDTKKPGVISMTTENKETGASEKDLADARAKAEADATKRIQSILGSEEAKERGKLAQHLAFNTKMSADDAIATLKVSAKDAPEKTTETPEQTTTKANETSFQKAMAKGNPEVTGSDTVEQEEEQLSEAAASMELFRQRKGLKKAK